METGDEALARPSPVFILSPPRGFSSVVCAMLGQHPELYGFPELNLFVTDTLGELFDVEDALRGTEVGSKRAYTGGLVRTVAELYAGAQTEETTRWAVGWLEERRVRATRQLLDDLLDEVAPRVGVEKSTRTATARAGMRRALAGYPQARFLHLTRHPAGSLRSMVASFAKFGVKSSPFVTECCSRIWADTHRDVLDFTRALPPRQTMRLAGEDLLADPRTHLRRVAEWLGVGTEAAAIEAMMHPERSPYAWPFPGIEGDADQGFLASPRLRRPCEPPGGTVDVPVEVRALAARLDYAV